MMMAGLRFAALARPVVPLVRGGRCGSTVARPPFTWNDFFALRMRRRRIGNVCSVLGAVTTTGMAWSYFANIELDMTQKMFGFDIIWIYGLGIVASGFVGYLVGPAVGDMVFKLRLGSRRAAQFAQMDSEFLRRVRRNRPDPSKQSYPNPLTDYYGEKIGSLRDYRRWLRDSHLFTRKSKKFL